MKTFAVWVYEMVETGQIIDYIVAPTLKEAKKIAKERWTGAYKVKPLD